MADIHRDSVMNDQPPVMDQLARSALFNALTSAPRHALAQEI
jgi:hypothetical protein